MDPADLGSDSLPPPPPVIPSAVAPLKAPDVKKSRPTRALVARSGFGTKGQKIQLLTNHFKVSMPNSDGHFFQYSVALYYEDGTAVDAKGIGRRVVDKVFETYDSELAGRTFAYDGEKSLFTLGPLPNNKLEFTVVLDEQASHRPVGQSSSGDHDYPTEAGKKRFKRPIRSKSYNVCISYATKVPLQAIASALRGQESVQFQEAVRVLDIVLRQHAAKQGCLLVRQSFFHNDPKNFVDIGGGVLGCRGFHSSFRATQGGLSLNIDVSTTMIVRPGPVIDFLLANQNVNNPSQIDWARAKRMLKNLRIKVKTTNMEYKVSGLSDKICYDQTFELKKRNGGEVQTDVITVYDYFVRHRDIKLQYSGEFPCINVGRPKSASYFPIELCDLVSLQRYTKALSNQQRASVVERSRQKPRERLEVLSDALKTSNYGSDALLRSSRISTSPQFTQVQGRVLSAPRVLYAGPEPSGCTLFIRYLNSVLELQGIYPHLKAGGGENFFPRNGRWNFNNKKLADPAKIDRWAIVNFSARCDNGSLARDLIKCGEKKGITISHPFCALDERGQDRRASASIRVEKMFEQVKAQLPGPPQLIVCVLPERKNCDIYGPWKRKCLAELGIATQCIAPTRMNDQYLTNVLLKINAKVGGINSLLSVENTPSMPLVSRAPTVIVGMDVSHGSPGRSDLPSIAAVVSSRGWPFISRYRASVRTQSPKVEMIDGLFKASVEPDGQKRDDGMFREALMDFYMSSEKRKPMQIIIFRDGVSEYQFNQVLNIELEQIKEACKFLDESWSPKFAVIVAQKNHHTKFFLADSPDNVPPGTVIDNMICHPRNNDFYMCAHAGRIGTTRPTHYHLLYDELGFSADDLQELVHSLSYVYQRSTTAVSLVAPICYAHLAASQMTQFIKFDDTYEKSSSHGGLTSVGTIPVPELPKLHRRVSNSMFFC